MKAAADVPRAVARARSEARSRTPADEVRKRCVRMKREKQLDELIGHEPFVRLYRYLASGRLGAGS